MALAGTVLLLGFQSRSCAYWRTVSSSDSARARLPCTTNDLSTRRLPAGRGRPLRDSPRAHRLGRLQRPAARKHREPAQQGALGLGRAGRSSSRSAHARSGGAATPSGCRLSAGETGRQALGDLLHRKGTHARRRELDRQRDPVQVRRFRPRPVAFCRDAKCRLRRDARSLNRRTDSYCINVSGVIVWRGRGRGAPGRIRRLARRAAARGSMRGSQMWTRFQQRSQVGRTPARDARNCRESRSRRSLQQPHQCLDDRPPGFLLHTEHRRDCLRNQLRVGERPAPRTTRRLDTRQ